MKKRFWTMLSWCVLPFIWIWAILCALWGKIVDWFVATRGRRVERTIVVLIIVLIIALFWKGLFPFSTNQSQSVQPAPVASSEATVQQEQGGVQAPPPAPEMAPVEQNVSARIEKSRVSRKRAREILKKIKD